jgi:RNA polymerase sigma factor (sigma-70 family)
MLDLDAALDRLAGRDRRQARIIELRFFGGLTEAEIAAAIGISERTVKREWKAGKAWLHAELRCGSSKT